MTRHFLLKDKTYIKEFSWKCCFSLNKTGFSTAAVVSLYNNCEDFSRQSNFSSNKNKEFFHDSHRFVIYKKKIRFINPEIRKTQVHKFTSNHGGECCTPSILEVSYGLIPLFWSNILNPIIPSKPSDARGFFEILWSAHFTSPPPKVKVKGKAVNRQTPGHTYRQTW